MKTSSPQQKRHQMVFETKKYNRWLVIISHNNVILMSENQELLVYHNSHE